MQSMTYRQARWLVLAFGTTVLLAVAASAFLRGADPVEVFAIVLFVPVTVALVLGGAVGGGIGGALASVVYLAVRLATLGGADAGEFAGSIVARVLLYLAFGVLGGLANRNLENQLRKLAIYDEVDDLTGVGNARSLLTLLDREAARAQRYRTTVSVGILHVDAAKFDALEDRRAAKAVKRFYGDVDRAVRTTDKVTRLATDEYEELTVILPETGPEGARVFVERARLGLAASMRELGMDLADEEITVTYLTLPGDEDRLEGHLDRVRALVDADLQVVAS